MNYHVIEARYVAEHVVWLRFRDGTSGEIDLASVLEGPVFEPLKDTVVFRQFQVHPEFHTLVWANGAALRTIPPTRSIRETVSPESEPGPRVFHLANT